jgi:hypothetical protein
MARTPPIVSDIKLADEVFIVVADLHGLHPEAEDFSIREILNHAEALNLTGRIRPGFEIHVRQHCVANLPPNPGRYCMLFASGKARRRLLREGDPVHPQRDGKMVPALEEVPDRYRHLLKLTEELQENSNQRKGRFSDLLALRGSGKKLWSDEGADQYVRRLREGWD